MADLTLHGFLRDDLEAIADGLDAGYEKTVNVGPSGGYPDVDVHVESSTAAAARFIRAALAPRPERWIVALETAVQIPGRRMPTLGYTVFADAEPFDSFDEASAFIKKHDLPIGWVAMQSSHTPWPALLGTDGVTVPAHQITPERDQ